MVHTRGGLRLGQPFSPIINPVSWQKKGLAIRHYVNVSGRPTVAAAEANLARAAIGARGKPFHLVGGIPYVASVVAEATAGRGTGGMSHEDRRRIAYASAEASLRRLESVATGAGSFPR